MDQFVIDGRPQQYLCFEHTTLHAPGEVSCPRPASRHGTSCCLPHTYCVCAAWPILVLAAGCPSSYFLLLVVGFSLGPSSAALMPVVPTDAPDAHGLAPPGKSLYWFLNFN